MNKTDFGAIQSFQLDTNNSVPIAAIKALHQDGVVCIRQAFSSEWLNVIEAGIELALSGGSTDLDIVKSKDDTGSFSVSSGAWRQVEEFRHFIFDSHIGDIALALLETKQLALFYDFLLIKEALSNNAATPWHQDHSYYPLDGTKLINSWLALDDIPIESSLRFMQASHQSGELYRAVDFDNPETEYRHARNELPPPPSEQANFPSTILSNATQAGDMLIWKSYTLHSAPGNQHNRRRAAFSVNWIGDDIVYNGQPSLETYRHASQVIGQPIICDKFPVVRGA
jgi:ectoine hydroxylase-related dioxygenase (phytanoyl-CoA dioxygenase family)